MGPAAWVCGVVAVKISIHPSRVGWDYITPVSLSANIYFNPPIPCGMGHCPRCHLLAVGTISIHPSRVGWDLSARNMLKKFFYFNPPIPCGMGLRDDGRSWGRRCDFNPPIPCGMGREEYGTRDDGTPIISIHPSRVGWDVCEADLDNPKQRFQSTHPVWDGTAKNI